MFEGFENEELKKLGMALGMQLHSVIQSLPRYKFGIEKFPCGCTELSGSVLIPPVDDEDAPAAPPAPESSVPLTVEVLNRIQELTLTNDVHTAAALMQSEIDANPLVHVIVLVLSRKSPEQLEKLLLNQFPSYASLYETDFSHRYFKEFFEILTKSADDAFFDESEVVEDSETAKPQTDILDSIRRALLNKITSTDFVSRVKTLMKKDNTLRTMVEGLCRHTAGEITSFLSNEFPDDVALFQEVRSRYWILNFIHAINETSNNAPYVSTGSSIIDFPQQQAA